MNISSYKDVIFSQWEVPILQSKLSVFIYFVDGLLVDTGPRSLGKENKLFFQDHKINQVVLTHIHEDHCGMASWLQENIDAPIFLHKDSIDVAAKKAPLPLYRLRLWGERLPFRAQSMPDEIRTSNHRFQPIDTLGHCANHIVLYEKEKGWLFTGDIFVSIKQHVAFREENLAQTIESLRRLLELDFDTMFCAHSGVIMNGHQQMEEKLEFLLELQEQVRVLEAQGLTPRQIDLKLFPIKHPMTEYSGGEGTSYHMVETLR